MAWWFLEVFSWFIESLRSFNKYLIIILSRKAPMKGSDNLNALIKKKYSLYERRLRIRAFISISFHPTGFILPQEKLGGWSCPALTPRGGPVSTSPQGQRRGVSVALHPFVVCVPVILPLTATGALPGMSNVFSIFFSPFTFYSRDWILFSLSSVEERRSL